VSWGECAGREVLTGGNMPVRLAPADAGKRRLCLDYSRTGVLRQSPRALRATRAMSEPPGSRCLRAGKTKSCDPRTLGDHMRKARIERRLRQGNIAALFQVDARTLSVRKAGQAHTSRYVKALVKSPRGLALDLSARMIGLPTPTDARAPLTGSPSANWALETAVGLSRKEGSPPS
jgi:hypothetical protein